MADYKYSAKVKFNIPNLILDNNIDGIMKNDRNLNMDLVVLTEKMKKEAMIYSNEYERLYQKELFDNKNCEWFSIPHILSFVSFAFSLLLFLIILSKGGKLKTLLSLTPIQAVEAVPTKVIEFHYNKKSAEYLTTEPQQLKVLFSTAEYSLISAQSFIIFLLLLVVGLHLYNLYKSLHYDSVLILEICGKAKRLNIKLTNLSKCPGDYQLNIIDYIYKVELTTRFGIFGKINLNWPDLNIKDKRTGAMIKIENKLSLSIYETIILKEIMKNNYFIYLKINHGGIARYLKKQVNVAVDIEA